MGTKIVSHENPTLKGENNMDGISGVHAGSDRKRTLSASYYIQPDILAREKENIFFRTWQFACHASELVEPGNFVTITIFDQKIFLTKGNDDVIRAFYNVCPHRGHTLVEGSGTKKRLTCPYHAWTFTLEGKLRGMPRKENTDVPSRSDICLNEVRVDQILDFIFVNLDPDAQSLAEFAPGLEEQMLEAVPDIREMVLVKGDTLGASYFCEANWKVMVDNYLECHHCAVAHDTFNDIMDIENSKFTLHPNYTHQVAPTRMVAENRAFPLDLEHDVTVAHFWFMYPNIGFGLFPGTRSFYLSSFLPVTPDQSRRTSTFLVPKEPTDPGMKERDRLRSEWSSTVVTLEDKALCENVQIGLHQRGYDQGWYVTDPEEHGISEHAMRHFHNHYLASMEAL